MNMIYVIIHDEDAKRIMRSEPCTLLCYATRGFAMSQHSAG